MKPIPLIALAVVIVSVATLVFTSSPRLQGVAIGILAVVGVVGFIAYRAIRRLGGK